MSAMKDVDESGFEEDDPSEVHQLVVAETGDRPANEDEEENEDGDFGEKAADVQQADPPGAGHGSMLGRMPKPIDQPPKKRVTMRAEPMIMAAYSPRKKRANFIEEYSVW